MFIKFIDRAKLRSGAMPRFDGPPIANKDSEYDLLKTGLAVALVFFVAFAIKSDSIFAFPGTITGTPVQDFWSFHAAAVSAFNGDAAMLYDAQSFRALFEDSHGLLWLYPPSMLVLMAPFGSLSYGVAKALWVFGSIVAAFGAAYLFSSKDKNFAIAVLASPALFAALLTGQLSVFFAVLLAIGLYFAKTRPLIAGICLGLLTVKPQLGLLVPFFLLFIGAWRTIGVAVITASLLVVVSIVMFGVEAWVAFFTSLTSTHADFLQHASTNGRITVADAIREFVWPAAPALIITAIVSICAIGLSYMTRHAALERNTYVAFVMMLTVLAAPYIWVYDWIIVVFAIALFLSDKPPLTRPSQLLILVVWFIPILPYRGVGAATIPIVWLVTAGLAVVMFLYLRAHFGRAERPAANVAATATATSLS